MQTDVQVPSSVDSALVPPEAAATDVDVSSEPVDVDHG